MTKPKITLSQRCHSDITVMSHRDRARDRDRDRDRKNICVHLPVCIMNDTGKQLLIAEKQVRYFVIEGDGQKMNEPFAENELLKLLSRLDVLTREADEISALAHRVNAELISIQRELYQRLNPSAKRTNDTHA